jgi:ribonuclease J
VLENRWNQLARHTGGKAPDVDWVGVQREIEVGLQRRLRRELQVEPLIICLVQPAPAGTPAFKPRNAGDERPAAPRQERERTPAAAPVPVAAPVAASAAPAEPSPEDNRQRRRRPSAVA